MDIPLVVKPAHAFNAKFVPQAEVDREEYLHSMKARPPFSFSLCPPPTPTHTHTHTHTHFCL
jgi:hypothetical protein